MAKDTSSKGYLDLKTELRSLLISSQQGCSEQQLMRDYSFYNGEKKIPFRDMGYKSFIELLTSMPDVARIDQMKTPMIIHGVSDHKTEHIKNFVMRQKSSKKKTGNTRGAYRATYGNNAFNRSNGPTTYARNQQSILYPYNTGIPFQPYSQIINHPRNPWDVHEISKVSYPIISYPSSSTINGSIPNPNPPTPIGTVKPTATADKMVASFPPKESRTPPLMSSSDITSIRLTPTNDDNYSIMDGDYNYTEDDELAAYDHQRALEHGEKVILLRKRVRQLLLKCLSGLWLSSVHKYYKKSFQEDLDLEEFQLKNLMAFFDCISDFVDSRRDPNSNSTDRILLLKPNFTEAAKREQQIGDQKPEPTASLLSVQDDQYSLRSPVNEIDRPIVDLSSFVPLDFQYNLVQCKSNEPFLGFLGDVEDPWNIHIGNMQFIPKRDRMMAELQDHYTQSSNQSIYNIPFEQIQIHLSCVYCHTDQRYYRSFIYHIDPTVNNDILILKVYLVDYGRIISNITYRANSTNLKFLHRNFSTLSSQIYECRLANVCYPPTSLQWPEDARQFIIDLCDGIEFSIEIVGFIDSLYSIYLWTDHHHQQSINQLLIQRGFAVAYDDSQNSESIDLPSNNNNNNNYIDERLLSRTGQHQPEYNLQENNFKHFIISIEHAYYFVKQPFTKRPCLPCFEVARLLGRDETYVSNLNLIRETELRLTDSYKILFDKFRALNESSQCRHIHLPDNQALIILYDLSSIRDHLIKIKFKDGDVIDAFKQEFENYERAGYWNETKNSYINHDTLESHQEDLYQRRNLLNIRKEQLVSLSKTSSNISTHNEIQEIENGLNHLNQELHSMETILPSPPEHHLPARSASTIKYKTSNSKMRETRFRIARPFEQQFALNVRFDHQLIDKDAFTDDNEEMEERLEDLHRITRNVIQFFVLEWDSLNEKDRVLLNEAESLSPRLTDNQVSLEERFNIYNYCLQIIEHFQPAIRSYVQRTDLIDTIY